MNTDGKQHLSAFIGGEEYRKYDVAHALGVPRRVSTRRLLLNCHHIRTSVETNLDAARTSARATIRHRISEYELLSQLRGDSLNIANTAPCGSASTAMRP